MIADELEMVESRPYDTQPGVPAEPKDHRKGVLVGFAIVALLIAGLVGATVLAYSLPDSDEEDTLGAAASRSDENSVREFLAVLGPDERRNPVVLVAAAERASIEIIDLLLESGWDANAPADSSELGIGTGVGSLRPGSGQVYPLADAVSRLRERVEIVQLLLDNGADGCALSTVDAASVSEDHRSESLMTPRELATRLEHQSVAEILPIC